MARMPPHQYDVSVEHGGRTHTGHYTVEHDMVNVTSFYGSRSTQLGLSQAEHLAESILRELVIAHESR